jgi:hypothetical protein
MRNDLPNTRNSPVLKGYDLQAWLERQQKFSTRTFGPGDLKEKIAAHIRKELEEALESNAVEEWIDIAILAFDQAWRAAGNRDAVIMTFHMKQQTNMRRKWPDWREVPHGQPVEHVRDNGKLR